MVKKLEFTRADNRVRPLAAKLLSGVMGIFVLVSLVMNIRSSSGSLADLVLAFLLLILAGLFIFCLYKGFTTAWFITLFMAISSGPWIKVDLLVNLFSLMLLGLLLYKPSIRYYFYLEVRNEDGSRVKKPVGVGAKLLFVLLVIVSIPVLFSFAIAFGITELIESFNQ